MIENIIFGIAVTVILILIIVMITTTIKDFFADNKKK
jgi:hypothetical protein